MLTDNGTHFTTPGNTSSAAPLIKEAMRAGEIFRAHAFEIACAQNDIDHRLTKPKHPWTNGQVERMNRTLKDATVKRYYYEATTSCGGISPTSSTAYNFARRLKTLKGPHTLRVHLQDLDYEPERFTLNPLHQMPGLNI